MHDDPPKQGEEAPDESFADILNEFEKSTRTAPAAKGKGKGQGKGRGRSKPAASPLHGTVVGVSGDFILIDYGAKSEGVIPAADLRGADGNLSVKRGDSFDVAITGYNSEGMATLSRVTGPRPRDWDGLMRAFENKEIIAGRVTASLKGGFSVDVGTRAFMPASRSGVRDAAEMEKLVGQEIRCRIIKLDVDDEDVVVDRRSVMEEEARQVRQNTLASLEEGAVVRGTVRSLADYGAFIDIGGVDGLLHVGDISWSRVSDPSAELTAGDVLDLKILKVDKRAVVRQRSHGAVHDRSLLQRGERTLPRLPGFFFHDRAAIDNNVLVVDIELDDADANLLTHECLHVFGCAGPAARGGQERARSEIDRKTALNRTRDPARHDFFVFERVLERFPIAGARAFHSRKRGHTLFVEPRDRHVKSVAALYGQVAFCIEQIGTWNHTFGFGSVINEDIVAGYAHYGAAPRPAGLGSPLGSFEIFQDVGKRRVLRFIVLSSRIVRHTLGLY